MIVRELEGIGDLKIVAGAGGVEGEIRNVYVCDLLGWAMSHLKEGAAWITILGHVNVVAVATLAGVSCVVLAEGANPSADTVEKANEEGVPIFKSELTAYQLAQILKV